LEENAKSKQKNGRKTAKFLSKNISACVILVAGTLVFFAGR
jgi:hypothetical protein